MKKILFVVAHMQMNGAMRSLLNLLSALDREKYDINLLIYAWGDILMDQIPSDVRLVPENVILRIFDLPFKQAIITAWSNRLFWVLVLRVVGGLKGRMFKSARAKERVWRYVDVVEDNYDVAIGFCEGTTHRFVVEKVKALKKMGWVHIDYNSKKGSISVGLNKLFYFSLDKIVAVSEAARQSLIGMFDLEKNKIDLIYNLVGDQCLLTLSKKYLIEKNNEKILIVSVGRLTYDKGFDLAIECAKLLKKRCVNFKWVIIGDGHDRKMLEDLMQQYGLVGFVVLAGMNKNPYPWIATCDIYVQPSRSESWGMTVTEAKVFGKAIVATDIPAFREQIDHEKTGLLAGCNAEEIAEAIYRLANDETLRNQLSLALHDFQSGDKQKLEAFDKMICDVLGS